MNELLVDPESLVEEYQATGSAEIETKLFSHYRRFILGVCKRRMSRTDSLGELESHAFFGAVDAFRTWKKDLGRTLESYVAYKVKFALIDGLRQFNNYRLREKYGITFHSYSQPTKNEENGNEVDDGGLAVARADATLEYSMVKQIIAKKLRPTDAWMLNARFIDGMNTFDIANHLGIKESLVHARIRHAISILRTECEPKHKNHYDNLSSHRNVSTAKESGERDCYAPRKLAPKDASGGRRLLGSV